MPENENKSTLKAISDSIDGWEEIAIRQKFGFNIDDLENQGSIGIRAIAFVELKREGQKDAAAHKAVMDLTMRELIDRYPEMETAADGVPDPMAAIDGDDSGKA